MADLRPAPATKPRNPQYLGVADPPGLNEDKAWKRYYADHNAQNQQRILQQESEKLSKVLDAAFPGSKRDSWTRNDLEAAVESSRRTYENKERIGRGIPRKLFHNVVRQLNAHSNLFSIIPSGNTYTSLIVGAVTILINASANHTKTIDELSTALDYIGEEIESCAVDAKLIVSDLTQTAIANLYIEVFQFYANAIIWYNSSRWNKIGKSLHNDFSQEFRNALDTIKEKAGLVRHAAELGSRAEIRVMSSNVDRLLTDTRDISALHSVEHRDLYALMQQQVGSLQDLQNMLVAMRTPSRGSTPVPVDSLQLTAEASHASTPAGTTLSASSVSVTRIRQFLSQAISQFPQIRNIRQYPQSQSTALFESQLVQSINQWLNTPKMQLCCLEYRATPLAGETDLLVGKQILSVVQTAGLPGILYSQSRAPEHPAGGEEYTSIVCAMLNIAKDVFDTLPEDSEQSSSQWPWLEHEKSSHDIDISKACHIFGTALGAAPANLHVIVIGHPVLSNISDDAAKIFLETIRTAARSDAKFLVLSQRKLVPLLPYLHSDEKKIVTGSRGSRIQQSRIVIHRK